MAGKDVLKYGSEYVPVINDSAGSDFGAYETYSRNKIDEKVKSLSPAAAAGAGYDWSGKTVVYEGESITMNSTIAYPEYVAQQTGSTAMKIGISGLPVMGNYSAGSFAGKAPDFRRRVSNIPADVDAIIILGDCNAVDTDQGNEYSTDISKWAGRWNAAIDAIRRSFPTVPVFLVSEYPMSGKDKQNQNVPVLFRALSQRYGCHFVCLAEESPLSLLYAQKTWGLTETDGVHCSHAAMPLFADVIIRHMKQTPPPEWSGADEITIDAAASVAVNGTASIGYEVTGDQSVQWTSDNMDVACVMGGTVYGMSAGTATITAATRNGHTATCTVTVGG